MIILFFNIPLDHLVFPTTFEFCLDLGVDLLKIIFQSEFPSQQSEETHINVN